MKLKFTWIPFILAIITGLSVRIYQILNGTHTTVSFLCNMENPSFVLILSISVFVLAIIIMSLLCKNELNNTIIMKKNTLSGILLIITAALLIINSVQNILTYVNYNDNMFTLVFGILSMLSAIILILIGISHIMGTKPLNGSLKCLSVLPTLWACVLLFKMFFTYSSIKGQTIDKMDFFLMIFITLFLFSQIKIICGFEMERTRACLWSCGMVIVISAIIYSLPMLLVYLFTGVIYNVLNVTLYVTHVAFAAYVMSMLISIYKDLPDLSPRRYLVEENN